MQTESQGAAPAGSEMTGVVERNIRLLVAQREEEETRRGWQEKVADTITRFTGSMRFVYLHLVLYGLWITVNLGWIPAIPQFDKSFVVLAMEASVEAIFLSTFILISQNRMSREATRRAELDLQITLLAEHEITRLIAMVKEIGDRMGIEAAKRPELNELARDVDPKQVLDTMERHEESMQRE